MRHPLVLLLALAATAALPASASAAPDRTGTVGATAPSYMWDGGPGSSIGANLPGIGGASVGNFVGCFDGIADCEETLIKVETAGKLTVTANSADDSKDVLDLYLFPSNAEGTFDEDEEGLGADGSATGASPASDETIVADVAPGFYMAQVKFFLADADTYKGGAVLSGFAAPAPAPAGTTPSAPAQPGTTPSQQPSQPSQQQPAQSQKPAEKKPTRGQRISACKKKANKRFKGKKNAKKRKAALKKCSKIR